MEIKRMSVLPKGWVRVTTEEEGGPDLFLRFRKGEDGRWRIHEVYFDSARPVSPTGLRQIPYAQCEEWANEMAAHLEARWDTPSAMGDNMAVLASWAAVTFTPPSYWPAAWGELRSNWVATAFFTDLDRETRKKLGLGYLKRPRKHSRKYLDSTLEVAVESTDPDRSYRLTEAPDTFPISDAFLEKVARAYRAAIERGDHPNVVISQDAHVDRRTAERWVSKARSRGFLGPARKGAAG